MKKQNNTILQLFSLVTIVAVFTPPLSAQDSSSEEETIELAPFTVTTASRTEKLTSAIPQTISVISPQMLDEQIAISGDLISSIAQLTPSYSPPRQKMTGFGETFRGRSPLFLIDGVPQSNPLRDGSRDGYTIDPAVIERIELVHGASAAQGMGATGGIINFITVKAPEEDGSSHWLQAGIATSDEFSSEGFGHRLAYRLGTRSGKLGGVFAAITEWRPMVYDGDGNLIGIDNTQGDTMNSRSLNLYGKISYELSDDQHFTFLLNSFEMEQDLEYISVPGNPEAGVPTGSEKGDTEGKPAANDVLTFTARYVHTSFLEGEMTLELFANDFAATYGGGYFGVFAEDGQIIFDQSENQSKKHGAKLTYVRDFGDMGIVTGIDYLDDTTKQVLAQTGREWVPETSFQSMAPYIQLDYPLGPLSFSGGLRFEMAELQVDDFTTLESYGAPLVDGGSPSFEELLLNIGATWMINPSWTLYASFAQGFGMADVGRVLRGISTEGQDVDDFLDLEPVVTDNYELGLRFNNGRLRTNLNAFWSTSDLGSRLQADADGIFSVMREKTEIYGYEVEAEWRIDGNNSVGTTIGHTRGRSDRDGDGDVETDLNGTIIPPTRVNLFWTHDWPHDVSTRLQTSTFFDRDALGFEGYTLIDLLFNIPAGPGVLSLAVENALDEQYITYYSQTAGNAGRYFAGRGRIFRTTFTMEF